MLADTGSNLAVARSLLAISALQLAVLALAALIAVARLLATQREGETALLAARGATRWQLARLTAAEVVPLSVVSRGGRRRRRSLAGPGARRHPRRRRRACSGVSPRAGGHLARRHGRGGRHRGARGGALLFPVLRRPGAPPPGPPRPAGGHRRRDQGRRRPGPHRAGGAGRLAAAPLLGRHRVGGQRRRPPSTRCSRWPPRSRWPAARCSPCGCCPAGARAADRLAARGRGLTGALAGWQFSRQPLRQGGAALLLVMAVATGTLALAQHASWSRSAADQAAFTHRRRRAGRPRRPAAGRLPARRSAGIPGVQSAMAAAAHGAVAASRRAGDRLRAGRSRWSGSARTRPRCRPARCSRRSRPAPGAGGTPVPGRPRSRRR